MCTNYYDNIGRQRTGKITVDENANKKWENDTTEPIKGGKNTFIPHLVIFYHRERNKVCSLASILQKNRQVCEFKIGWPH